jgi:hypothetical protein
MKAILEFNLPEDKSDFIIAQNGIKYYCAIRDIEDLLRKKVKYESDKYTNEQMQVIEEIREEILNIIHETESIDIG